MKVNLKCTTPFPTLRLKQINKSGKLKIRTRENFYRWTQDRQIAFTDVGVE